MGAGTAVTVTGIVTWIKMENTLVSAGFACHHVILSSCHHSLVFNIAMDGRTNKHTSLGLTGILRRQI